MKEVAGTEKYYPADLILLAMGFLGPEKLAPTEMSMFGADFRWCRDGNRIIIVYFQNLNWTAEVTSRLQLAPMERPIPKYSPPVTAVVVNLWWFGPSPRDDRQPVKSIAILSASLVRCQDQVESLIYDRPKSLEPSTWRNTHWCLIRFWPTVANFNEAICNKRSSTVSSRWGIQHSNRQKQWQVLQIQRTILNVWYVQNGSQWTLNRLKM